MAKPIIIDYPENREALKREFDKIASGPGFKESVRKALEVLYGPGHPAIEEYFENHENQRIRYNL